MGVTLPHTCGRTHREKMLARIFPARSVLAGARAANACRARFAHAQASGKASDNALTIQKMSTAEWAEAFKKVRVHTKVRHCVSFRVSGPRRRLGARVPPASAAGHTLNSCCSALPDSRSRSVSGGGEVCVV